MILAIDPGNNKCGLALLNEDAEVLEQKIIPRQDIIAILTNYYSKDSISALVIGQSSFGKDLEKELSKAGLNFNIVTISEKDSTLEARKLYWQNNPAKGLWAIIPATLRFPLVPIDDYAAIILGNRYLKS